MTDPASTANPAHEPHAHERLRSGMFVVVITILPL
jgi:hypothetical protein